MAIFNLGLNDDGILNESAVDMDDIQEVMSTYDDPEHAALETVLYTESNYNKLMEAVYVNELSAYAESGAEMIYEGKTFKEYFDQVVEFFKSILRRIKGIFLKFIATITKWVASDKQFVLMFQKEIKKGYTGGDFKAKGFAFTNLDFKLAANDVVEKTASMSVMNDPAALKAAIEDFAETKTESSDKIRGMRLDGKGSIEKKDFKKECFKFFRNGSDTKVDITKVDVNGWLNQISDTKAAKSAAKASYDSAVGAINKEIARVRQLQKEVEKKDEARNDKMKYANNYIYLLKEDSNACTIINGSQLKAIAQYNRQCKSLCIKLINHTEKKDKAVGEGASLLSQVQFE